MIRTHFASVPKPFRMIETPLTSDTKSEETDGEDSLGAPAGSVYEGHSGEIVDTPNDLLDNAEAQLDDARVTETADLHKY